MKLDYGSVVNSIDPINRWEELNSEHESLMEAVSNIENGLYGINSDPLEEDERLELCSKLAQAEKELADWEDLYLPEFDALSDVDTYLNNSRGRHIALYHEDYMEEYAKEVIEENYPELLSSRFPICYVTLDYDGIAAQLMCDMNSVEIGDDTYYYNG